MPAAGPHPPDRLPDETSPQEVVELLTNVIAQAGRDIARECARVLTVEAAALASEFEGKQYPLPRGVMPR